MFTVTPGRQPLPLRLSRRRPSPPFHHRSKWVEVFERLGYHVFEALCHPRGVGLALRVLGSFLHGSQLRDAALRYELHREIYFGLSRLLITVFTACGVWVSALD